MRILNKEQEESMYRLIEKGLELNNKNNKLQKRIDKAIELIEADYFEDGSGENIEKVLEILKGSDKE